MPKKYEYAVPHQQDVPSDRVRKAFRDINEQFKQIAVDVGNLNSTVAAQGGTTPATQVPVLIQTLPSAQPIQQPSAGATPLTATFVTVANESATLPDSRQIAAGVGISLIDAGAGSTLTITSTAPIQKAQRVTTGAIPLSSTAQVTLTWTTPFADALYTPVVSVVDSSGFLEVVNVASFSATQVVVNVINNDGSNPHTGTLCVMALHD